MSNDDVPRFEPWLGVLVASLVPVAVGIAVPSIFIPSAITTGVLFVTSLVMLKVQSAKRPTEAA